MVVAVAGFDRKHSPHVHPPPDEVEGFFKPAAAQSNDWTELESSTVTPLQVKS